MIIVVTFVLYACLGFKAQAEPAALDFAPLKLQPRYPNTRQVQGFGGVPGFGEQVRIIRTLTTIVLIMTIRVPITKNHHHHHTHNYTKGLCGIY